MPRHSMILDKASTEVVDALAEVKAVDEVPFMDMQQDELDKFMREPVVVNVFESAREGELDVCSPEVNGVKYNILRGKPTRIPRFVVEALARARTTNITQKEWNPHSADSLRLINKTGQSYPFEVVQDSQRGRDWLKHIYQQQI